jgi:hypothetical protein
VAEKYLMLNAKYLLDGDHLLAEGDLPQASEKFWGATAEAVTAVAEQRGMRHYNHRELRGLISLLNRETGDKSYLDGFAQAEALHANFYEDYMDEADVRYYSAGVKVLIDKLKGLLN